MEQETQKMKELDDQYTSELREWKQQLVPRKQVRSCDGAEFTERSSLRAGQEGLILVEAY